MSNYLIRLVARSMGLLDLISPRSLSLFEPMPLNDDLFSLDDRLSQDFNLKRTGSKENDLKEIGLNDAGSKDIGLKEIGLKKNGLKETDSIENCLKETCSKEKSLKEVSLKDNDSKRTDLIENCLNETCLKEKSLKEIGLKENSLKDTSMNSKILNKNIMPDDISKINALKNNKTQYFSFLTGKSDVHKSAAHHSLPKSRASAFSFLTGNRHSILSDQHEKAQFIKPSIYAFRSNDNAWARTSDEGMEKSIGISLSHHSENLFSSQSACPVGNLQVESKGDGSDIKIKTLLKDLGEERVNPSNGLKSMISACELRGSPVECNCQDVLSDITQQVGRIERSAEGLSNDVIIEDKKKPQKIDSINIKSVDGSDLSESGQFNEAAERDLFRPPSVSSKFSQAALVPDLRTSCALSFPSEGMLAKIADKIDSGFEKRPIALTNLPDDSNAIEDDHSHLNVSGQEKRGYHGSEVNMAHLKRGQSSSGDAQPFKNARNNGSEDANGKFVLDRSPEIISDPSINRPAEILSSKFVALSRKEPAKSNDLENKVNLIETSIFKSGDSISLSEASESNEGELNSRRIIDPYKNRSKSSKMIAEGSFQEETQAIVNKQKAPFPKNLSEPFANALWQRASKPWSGNTSKNIYRQLSLAGSSDSSASFSQKLSHPSSAFILAKQRRKLEPESSAELDSSEMKENPNYGIITNNHHPEIQEYREVLAKYNSPKFIKSEDTLNKIQQSEGHSAKIILLKSSESEDPLNEIQQSEGPSTKNGPLKSSEPENPFVKIRLSRKSLCKSKQKNAHQSSPGASVYESRIIESEPQSKAKFSRSRRQSSLDRPSSLSIAQSPRISEESFMDLLSLNNLNPSITESFNADPFVETKAASENRIPAEIYLFGSAPSKYNFNKSPRPSHKTFIHVLQKNASDPNSKSNSGKLEHDFSIKPSHIDIKTDNAMSNKSRSHLYYGNRSKEPLSGFILPKYNPPKSLSLKINASESVSANSNRSHAFPLIQTEDRSLVSVVLQVQDQDKMLPATNSSLAPIRSNGLKIKNQQDRMIATKPVKYAIQDGVRVPGPTENDRESKTRGSKGKVKVIIGRVDVHLETPPSPQRPRQGRMDEARLAPMLSLEGYLKKRNEGKL